MLSQEGQGYVVSLNNDTVFMRSIKIDRKKRAVNCEGFSGKKAGFKAAEVLSVRLDTSIYESGLVRLKPLKKKRYVFLHKTITGKLNLYEISVRRTKLSWKTVGYNFITLRWIYRSNDARIKYFVTKYFYKRENEFRESISRNWKSKTRDCKAFNDKLSSKLNRWVPGPAEIVHFYNKNCN
jgi:hypothetical protein